MHAHRFAYGAQRRRVAAAALPTSRPDVFMLNDFRASFGYNDGGTDTDGAYVLPPMVMASDQINYVGFGCTFPTGSSSAKTTLQSWFTTTYAADYTNYVSKRPAAQAPAALSAMVYQGSLTANGAQGYGVSNELVVAMHTRAQLKSPDDKLNVVVGGTFTDVTTWFQLYPGDIPNVRLIAVALDPTLYNYYSDANSGNYLMSKLAPGQAWAALEVVAINQTLYGQFEDGNANNRDREFPLAYAAGHGTMGDFLMDACIDTFLPGQNWNGWNGGDYCGLLYVMDIAAGRRAKNDPTAHGWAGWYQKDATKGDNYYSDVQSGQTLNSKPGALTINGMRNTYRADLAAKFDDCMVTAPIIKGYDDLEDIPIGGIADITGRTIKGGTGLSWKNMRPAAASPVTAIYETPSSAYLTDSVATSFLFQMDGVVGDASGNLEVMMIGRTDDNSASGSGGLALAASGDTTTGTYMMAFLPDNVNYTIQKFVNGSGATASTVTQASTLAVTTNKKYFQRLKVVNNGNSTYTYTWHQKYGYGAWTLITSFTDTTSPINIVGKVPMIRGRQNTRIYGVVARVPGV